MSQNALLAIAATVGLLAGAGGTWRAMPGVEAQALSKVELTAANLPILLCALFRRPRSSKAPTEDEALAAFRKAQENSPLVWDRNNMPEISLTLGQCDKNSSGPGVSCMTSIKMSPQAQPLDRVVGFAKDASGEWIATIN
ncbi:hypothetical protein [Mesorhizobium sp.]|uniref:hypothetical protein n=1 Tax=Mesorhizobium sp. TaxID=1871066 RepID=UPI00257F766B|nr:hypothetical protein [Mesorhizobium sp.]